MVFYLYKITNKINGHYYYGRRVYNGEKAEEDPYFGSGKRLKLAIKKHGVHNFFKEIVALFDTEEDLINAEKLLVNEQVVKDPNCYNLALGGHGGYTFYSERIFTHSPESKEKISKANKGRARPDARETFIKLGLNKWWAGRTRTEEDRNRKKIATKNTVENGTHASKQLATCPYCLYTTGIGNARRWHFNNCKKKQVT